MPLLSLTVVFSVKDLLMKNLLLVFSVYHIVVVTQTLNLKFLLGDNFFDIFFYDTLFFALFSFQGTIAQCGRLPLNKLGGPGKTRTCDLTLIRRAL